MTKYVTVTIRRGSQVESFSGILYASNSKGAWVKALPNSNETFDEWFPFYSPMVRIS